MPGTKKSKKNTNATSTKATSSSTTTAENNGASEAVEYDSDGNNLYGDNKEDVSVSDETAVASNGSPHKRSKTSGQKKLAPIFEKNKSVTVYENKTIFVAGLPVRKTKKATDEYNRAIKEFLKELNEHTDSATLYEMYNADSPTTFELKNWQNFPNKPSLVKQYLAGCNPYAGDGMIYATFHMGFNEDEECLIWTLRDWAKSIGGTFKKKELQVMQTERRIWFCFSHEHMDVESLCQAQKNQYKFEMNEDLSLALQWSVIKDGNMGFYKIRAREHDDSLGTRRYVRGIIAETSKDQYDSYFEWVMKTYSRSSNVYPLGIKLRAVPIISKEYDADTIEKIQLLMQRQEHYQDSITSTHYIHVSNIDTKLHGTDKTLREHLMSIPISTENAGSLFVSIGQQKWGQHRGDYAFTYPKKYAKHASRIVSNLNSYCHKHWGENILKQFFTVRATKQALETQWDEKEGRAISLTERNLASVLDEFTELGYVELHKPSHTNQQKPDTSAPPVTQVDAASQDDISSFGNSLLGGQRQTAPRQTAFAITPSEDQSVAGKSVAASVASLESRMTEIERRLETIDRLEQILLRSLPAPMDTSSQDGGHNNVVGDSTAETADGAPAP